MNVIYNALLTNRGNFAIITSTLLTHAWRRQATTSDIMPTTERRFSMEKLYELTVLLHPDLEIDLDKPLKKLEEIIKNNKGEIVKRILYNYPDAEFVFCAGDDKVRRRIRRFAYFVGLDTSFS